MTKTSKPIVFFGNERIATGVSTTAPTLRGLIDAGYTIAAIVAHNDHTSSRKVRTLEVGEVAKEHNIPLLLPATKQELVDCLKPYPADIGVLVAYGKMVPNAVIDLFPHGIVNIHPSLLPSHRGPTPLESVILSGETETGVSIMQLAQAMDAGPVYKQQKVPVPAQTDKQQLADTLLSVGGAMLLDCLPSILDNQLQPKPQNDADAMYDALIQKTDGMIDWSESAEQIERKIRAYALWPRSKATLGDVEVIITAVSISETTAAPGALSVQDGQLTVGTANGSLVIHQLIPAGKKAMDSRGFIAGYRSRLGL